MLLDSIVIVLRETLEASILIALLLSVQRSVQFRQSDLQKNYPPIVQIEKIWLPAALVCGAISALLYAHNLGSISEWFDYAGQEVINATMQYCLSLSLILFLLLVGLNRLRLLPCLMLLITALAITREGAEIFIFYRGFVTSSAQFSGALTSGFIGLMIGVSVGVLVFYSLTNIRPQKALVIQALLAALIAAGLAEQATQLLLQIDWLESAAPVWDSSALLPEHSVIGQLCYAVFGYEATPTGSEVLVYCMTLVAALLTFFLPAKISARQQDIGNV